MIKEMSIVCPLSGESNVLLLEKIAAETLKKVYRQSYLKLDISSELDQVQEIGLYHCTQSDLKFFYPAVSGSEKFYEKLQKFDWYYANDKYEYEYVKDLIKQTDSVLEIGCGNGAFAEKINVQGYVGLELSEKAQKMASRKGFTVLQELVEAHAVSKPQCYDVVCAFQVLEHVADVRSFIQASVQCLKPGGLLIYSVPSADSFYALLTNNLLNIPPHHITWWSDKSLTYVADFLDLKLVSIHHEKLAPIHKKGYLAYLITQSLKKIFGIRERLLDDSILYRLLSKFSTLTSRFLEPGLQDDRALPNGHSAIVVYQKKR
jgi:2-polyprenyl-3-methyl-5-hydroxy-6-metoxy-1,4-benzoquinol methylase